MKNIHGNFGPVIYFHVPKLTQKDYIIKSISIKFANRDRNVYLKGIICEFNFVY
jgi:hypothetical protein